MQAGVGALNGVVPMSPYGHLQQQVDTGSPTTRKHAKLPASNKHAHAAGERAAISAAPDCSQLAQYFPLPSAWSCLHLRNSVASWSGVRPLAQPRQLLARCLYNTRCLRSGQLQWSAKYSLPPADNVACTAGYSPSCVFDLVPVQVRIPAPVVVPGSGAGIAFGLAAESSAACRASRDSAFSKERRMSVSLGCLDFHHLSKHCRALPPLRGLTGVSYSLSSLQRVPASPGGSPITC